MSQKKISINFINEAIILELNTEPRARRNKEKYKNKHTEENTQSKGTKWEIIIIITLHKSRFEGGGKYSQPRCDLGRQTC